MSPLAPVGLLLLVAAPAAADALSADEIMRRVAENQDRAVDQRDRYVFQQRARVRITKGADKLKRQDTRIYRVAPTPDGLDKKLVEREVLHRSGGERLEFRFLDVHHETDIEGVDRELADEFHDELIGRRHESRDGIARDLFPLTSGELPRYQFTLDGEEVYRGRRVYRIRYEPRKKTSNKRPWKGEALIDQDALQPVVVTSELAWKVPIWVKTVFGVDIQQLGFKLAYEKFAEGVWFPVSYGGEFRIKVLHFFRRRAMISLVNEDFQRTAVESSVRFSQ